MNTKKYIGILLILSIMRSVNASANVDSQQNKESPQSGHTTGVASTNPSPSAGTMINSQIPINRVVKQFATLLRNIAQKLQLTTNQIEEVKAPA